MDTLDLLAASLAWGLDTPGFGAWLRERPEEPVTTPQRALFQRLRRSPDTRALLQRLRHEGWQLLPITDQHFPPLLRQIPDPPGLLFLRGNRSCLQRPALAMVGARHGSPGGCRQARTLASQLAGCGFLIVSGLALGVDGAAHRGALERGLTLAVLGHGPDTLYPACHRALADTLVAAGGALVTEFPPGQGPRKALFPQRNRLISGLCRATLVVEAAQRSGSLVTARLAADQGRDVFAMPGSVSNPFARGCHQLLRDGAQWLETAEDVLAQIPPPQQPARSGSDGTGPTHPLLALVGDDTLTPEALAQRSGMPLAQLASALTALELAGELERVAGGYRRTGG